MPKKRKILFIIGMVLIALGVGYLSYSAASAIRAKKNQETLHSIAFRETSTAPATEEATTVPVTSLTPETETQPAVTTTEYHEPYVSPIDFEALWKINPDIYAWLELVDTDISYPVLQHPTDNEYYLYHTPERVSGYPGSIFSYNVNAKDFTDFNTVLYGHRLSDGTMFSKLHEYRDESYLKDHRIIKVYLPDRELIYTIFASVIYDDRLITHYYDFTDPASCRAYLDSIYGNRDLNSHILSEPQVTENDRILTLSTCIKWQKTNRYLVVAVLTDEIT